MSDAAGRKHVSAQWSAVRLKMGGVMYHHGTSPQFLRKEMAKKRQPKELWYPNRHIVWERDGKQCVRCQAQVTLKAAHIDHIVPLSQGGKNELSNERTLCRRCHVLRMNNKHRGMIAKALKDGIIPPNWRELLWEG